MSKEKWIKGTVALSLQCRDSVTNKLVIQSRDVPCIKKGIWAIHKNYGYGITHIPSGMLLVDLKRQRDCKALVEEINHIDWSTQPGIAPHFKHIEESKPIIHKYKQANI